MSDTKALVEYLNGLAPKLQGNGELIGMQDAYDASQACLQAVATIERLEAEVDRLNEQVAYEQALNQVSN